MRPRISWIAAAALLGTTALVPALGVTIEPGVYNMEWRVPASDDVSFGGRRGAAMGSINDQQISRFKGLSSAKAFIGRTDRCTVILDESKGTGTGYDAAYVFENLPDDSEYDLGSAVKIKLKRNGQVLVPQDANGHLVDRTIGDEGSRITKKVALSLSVHMTAREDGKEEPRYAVLTLRGGWYGKINTDAGELDVQVIDINLNGIYNDKLSVDREHFSLRPGDMILVGGTPKTFEEYRNLVYVAETVSYDGKLYNFDVSTTGDAVKIETYTGDVGKISVSATDGHNKPTHCSTAAFYSQAGMFFGSGKDLTVPPGNYKCLMAVIVPEQSGPKEKRFGITVRPGAVVNVVRDKKTVVKVGGPMKVEIEPGSRTITAKAGQQKRIRLAFTVGGAALAGVDGSRRAWVNIRDSKGKLLSSEQSGFT